MEKKPTWKSTTFILVVVTQALNILAAVAQYIPPKYAAIIFAGLTGIFAGCNAWIKVSQTPAPTPAPVVAPVVEVKP